MNVVSRQTIRTGTHEGDDHALEQLRLHAVSQGCQLQVQRLPEGGYQVDVVRHETAMVMAPQQAAQLYGQERMYGQPPPMQQWNQAFGGPPPGPRLTRGVCQACGRHAPTQNVTLYQNIGVIIMRFPRQISGELCRTCIGTYFWKFTIISFFFGWWGVISFFVNFVTIPINCIMYFGALSLPKEFPPGERAS